ncbi:MAG: hypothetical protein EU531_08300 [Promethearchaeota archaeon]|nr:MAG: hypothetical protein EU531_08300 [Candidatus Lokiarchaeota archaeon]
MKKKVVIPIIAIIIIGAILIPVLVLMFLNPPPTILPSERKALLLGSANDFYESEPDGDFNDGGDSSIDLSPGNWTFEGNDCTGEYTPLEGNPIGSLTIFTLFDTLVSGNFSLDYSEHYDLIEYALYNITVDVKIQSDVPLDGTGVRIGLQWLNSIGETVRVDWSEGILNITNSWFSMNLTGVCNNETNNEITDLNLVLSVEASFPDLIPNKAVYFDNIKIDRWISVNVSLPVEPPPSPGGINSDGFPAQVLQVYWILKDHGYTDENILLMLYWKNDIDGLVNIYRNDGILDDTVGAVIDILDDDVNASRFKRELDVSVEGSFANSIKPNDYLIIYMVDHGSNKIFPNGSATFHFEADNSFITEFEFYNLVKEITCSRMMINVDCCFSGNFLNSGPNVGNSWYDIPNCIMVTASSNRPSWYWINNANGDGWAGSWFFHVFWDALDNNATINTAYNVAINFIPFNQAPLIIVQNPLIYDNMGVNMTLSFNSDPPL